MLILVPVSIVAYIVILIIFMIVYHRTAGEDARICYYRRGVWRGRPPRAFDKSVEEVFFYQGDKQ